MAFVFLGTFSLFDFEMFIHTFAEHKKNRKEIMQIKPNFLY